MNKKYLFGAIFSLAVMVFLPLLTVHIVSGGGAFIAFIFLLLIINPLYMICLGFYCGKNIRTYWSLPLVASALFWCGAALFLKMDIEGCILYFAVYISAALVSMFSSYFLFHKYPQVNLSAKTKLLKTLAFTAILIAFFALVFLTATKLD